MNSNRGELLRQECTGPARSDQPALDASGVDALMERVVAPANLERAWRQVKRNRGRAPTAGWSRCERRLKTPAPGRLKRLAPDVVLLL